jgi:hypothetical protein
MKQYNLIDIYKEQGWNGLTPEAQNAINKLKTINTDWNDYYSEMLSRKNITLAFPVVVKRLLITTHLVMSKKTEMYQV